VPLTLAAVCAFALGQPLLDLFGRNPEFFIAHGFTSFDVLLFPLVLLVLIPLLLSVPVLTLRLVGPRTAGIAHAIVIGALFSTFVATAWVALLGGNGSTTLFVAVVVGVGVLCASAYLAYPVLQTGILYAAWAVAVFAVWFLLMTPAGRVALARTGDLLEPGQISNQVPVVLLVFDEFPLATMIDSQGNLLSEQFPNFAKLAGDGVWYRNAIGVRQRTEEALPSILTGIGADESSIPVSSDHPLTIFTLLSDTYDVTAVETVTDLCPDFACRNASRHIDPIGDRWGAFGVDLAIVYSHLSTPREISAGLPAIDQTWGNFTTSAESDFDVIDQFLASVDNDRRLEVDRFLDTLEFEGPEPAFRFGHVLYPHHPWELIPDGRRTGARGSAGAVGKGWRDDEWLAAQGYQRHILQSQYTDNILGDVIGRLREAGVYEDALVIAVADHGITISPGVEHQRLITEETVGTIAAVPLFVKYPDGHGGVTPGTIDDVRSETVDLLPTIADVIQTVVPWQIDGMSLLDPARSARESSVMVGADGPVRFGVDGEEKLAAAALKETWFVDGDPWTLAPPGWRHWLGRPISETSGSTDSQDVRVWIRQQSLLTDLADDADQIPTFMSGSVTFDEAANGDEILFAVVDGVVRGVTRVYDPEGAKARFEVMIPPDLIHPGANDIVLWVVSGDPGQPSLVR
jgi:hypothetical protein